MRKKVIIVFGAILFAALGVFFFFLPGYVGRRMNATIERPPYAASERAKALHKTLIVADLHADTLMWDRDLLERALGPRRPAAFGRRQCGRAGVHRRHKNAPRHEHRIEQRRH